jgi:flagellar protein FliS
MGIINGLQNFLDKKADPELYERLYALYGYMLELLNQAQVSMKPEPIDECINLVIPIKQAWDQIPLDVKEKVNAKIMNK